MYSFGTNAPPEPSHYLGDEFYEEAEGLLETRLAPKRFDHSVSVSRMAVDIAKTYGVDTKKARIAGLIHDWDKEYSDKQIKARALDLGISVNEVVLDTMPRLLHSHTAAAALARDYPGIPADVLQAIDRHTSAAIDMTDLDMTIYVADAIEPLRKYGDMEKLRSKIGEVSLEKLFVLTFKHVFLSLLERNYAMHPQTVEVWNYYMFRAQARKRAKGSDPTAHESTKG